MIIKKYKNGKKVVQTTSEELANNIQVNPSTPVQTQNVVKKKVFRNITKTVATPAQKPKKKRGCGCGR